MTNSFVLNKNRSLQSYFLWLKLHAKLLLKAVKSSVTLVLYAGLSNKVDLIRAQLFKTNDAISERILKTLIIKYGIYANIFAEKMWVAFAFAKATHIFQKNTYELGIALTITVNILTTNELIKWRMLLNNWALIRLVLLVQSHLGLH